LTYTSVADDKFPHVATFWLVDPKNYEKQVSAQDTKAEAVDFENAFLSNWFPSAWTYAMKLGDNTTIKQHVKTAMAAVLLERAKIVSPEAVKSCQEEIDRCNADYDINVKDPKFFSDLKAATVYTAKLLNWAAAQLPSEKTKDWEHGKLQKLIDVQKSKFLNIPRLSEILSRFPKGTLFVEANPEDKSSGIGQRASSFLEQLAASHRNVAHAMQGLGENMQGQALVSVAKELQDSGGLPVEELAEDSDADGEPVHTEGNDEVTAQLKNGCPSLQGPALWAVVGFVPVVQYYVSR
jgi:predicted NAD-dependent protein-ADP-ribosyltransferase YbiA (DUF1768 family)